MKKILTLSFFLGGALLASAQSTREMEDARDIILGQRKSTSGGDTRSGDRDVILGRDNRTVYEDNRTGYPSSSSSEARSINREYDAKIQSIRNNRYLSSAEKERAIRQLEADRARRLRNLEERYSNDRKRYDDRDDDRRYSSNNKNNNYKKKSNNGNHYGWQKGKGNPHKDQD